MKHLKLIFFVFLTFTVNAQQLYFPGQDWEEREPQSLGFSNEKIKEAQETVLKTQLKVQEEIQKELMRMQKKMIAELSMKELEDMVQRLGKKNLYKEVEKIPEYIRKKVG